MSNDLITIPVYGISGICYRFALYQESKENDTRPDVFIVCSLFKNKDNDVEYTLEGISYTENFNETSYKHNLLDPFNFVRGIAVVRYWDGSPQNIKLKAIKNDIIRNTGSVQLSVSILFIILGSLVFPCGGMTGGRRPEGRPPQGMVNIL